MSESALPGSKVAYVVKGYPRMSELFIASEIWRLEQLGVGLRLYVLKEADEAATHAVVERIAVVPEHLPATGPLSGRALAPWLWENAGPYLPALVLMARRSPARFLRALGAAGAQSVRARKGWRPRTIYVKEFLQAAELAARVARGGDVTHLHAHFAHGTTTVTWLAAILTGLPFSFTAHAKDIYRESLNPAGLLARKLRAADFVVTCTGANAAHLRALAPGAAVHLGYHGLNADFAALLPGGPRTEPTRPLVVSVGRLVPKKGFDVLLAAMAALRGRGVDVDLEIIGEEGDDADRVSRLIAELALSDRVVVRGPQGQAELLATYRRSTLFALACRVDADGDRDGIPNVLTEAMAAGLPVVSTTVSGIPELVRDGVNGVLVPPDDPLALAGAIERLVADPAARRRLAAAAADTVARDFDGDVLARRLADLFGAARPARVAR